jgi:hypothetical protein
MVTRVTTTSMGVYLPRQRLLTVIGSKNQFPQSTWRTEVLCGECATSSVLLQCYSSSQLFLNFLVEFPDLLRVSAVAMFIARWLFRDRE